MERSHKIVHFNGGLIIPKTSGFRYQRTKNTCVLKYNFISECVLFTFSISPCLSPLPYRDALCCLCKRRPFGNIVANGRIAHNEQFLLLLPRFKLYAIIVISVKESFHIIYYMPSKSSAVDLTYVGNGLSLHSDILCVLKAK